MKNGKPENFFPTKFFNFVSHQKIILNFGSSGKNDPLSQVTLYRENFLFSGITFNLNLAHLGRGILRVEWVSEKLGMIISFVQFEKLTFFFIDFSRLDWKNLMRSAGEKNILVEFRNFEGNNGKFLKAKEIKKFDIKSLNDLKIIDDPLTRAPVFIYKTKDGIIKLTNKIF